VSAGAAAFGFSTSSPFSKSTSCSRPSGASSASRIDATSRSYVCAMPCATWSAALADCCAPSASRYSSCSRVTVLGASLMRISSGTAATLSRLRFASPTVASYTSAAPANASCFFTQA
jgi:hypothetical protein